MMSLVRACTGVRVWTPGAPLQTCQLNPCWRLGSFTDPQVSVTNCPVRLLVIMH